MSQEWYYSVDGSQKGPVPASELKKLADAGGLKEADLVWKEGMADWAPAKSIKGLFTASAAAPAAAASPARAEEPVRSRPQAEADDRPSSRGRRREEDDEDDRPRRRRDADDEDADDDDRPSGRVRRREDDDEEDRPVRRRGDEEEDDYDDDRPRKRKRGRVPEDTGSKKMVAGLLGILLGGFAVHKFYLGYTGTAVLQLCLSVITCGVIGWIGLIEGIIYLCKSDEDFHRDYVVNQKQWF